MAFNTTGSKVSEYSFGQVAEYADNGLLASNFAFQDGLPSVGDLFDLAETLDAYTDVTLQGFVEDGYLILTGIVADLYLGDHAIDLWYDFAENHGLRVFKEEGDILMSING